MRNRQAPIARSQTARTAIADSAMPRARSAHAPIARPVVVLALALACLAALVLPTVGCGGAKSSTGSKPLLPSEQRLEGMYESCKTIELSDGSEKKAIETSTFSSLPAQEFDAVLVRSNGMKITNHWKGVSLGDVLASAGVAAPYGELKFTAWDGYVGRVPYDIASKPDTILAYEQDGKPLPREDGPVRLVVASEDGFYWIRMITDIEVIR